MFFETLTVTILPLAESAIAAFLLRWLARGRLWESWPRAAGISTVVLTIAIASCIIAQSLSPVIVDRYVKDGTTYVIPYHSVQVYFASVLVFAFVAGGLVLLVLRWQTGERPRGIGLMASAMLVPS